MTISSNDRIINLIDSAVTTLLEQMDPGIRDVDGNPPDPEGESSLGVIDFGERLKAIELGVKWVATKNKLDAGDQQDEFSRLRGAHVRGSPRRSRAVTASPNGGSA
jgi:hypothetical protein